MGFSQRPFRDFYSSFSSRLFLRCYSWISLSFTQHSSWIVFRDSFRCSIRNIPRSSSQGFSRRFLRDLFKSCYRSYSWDYPRNLSGVFQGISLGVSREISFRCFSGIAPRACPTVLHGVSSAVLLVINSRNYREHSSTGSPGFSASLFLIGFFSDCFL